MCGHNTQPENTFLIENDQIILNCVTIWHNYGSTFLDFWRESMRCNKKWQQNLALSSYPFWYADVGKWPEANRKCFPQLYRQAHQAEKQEAERQSGAWYLNCSVLKKGIPLHFDGVSTPEKSALLNLHVDWGHLALIIQAAPDYPTEKLAEALANTCRWKAGLEPVPSCVWRCVRASKPWYWVLSGTFSPAFCGYK